MTEKNDQAFKKKENKAGNLKALKFDTSTL